jgi:hypothetical protein
MSVGADVLGSVEIDNLLCEGEMGATSSKAIADEKE